MSDRITRITVNAALIEPLGDRSPEECEHEVTWFSKVDWVERCAICGLYLGLWPGRPKEPKGTVW